MKYSFSCHVCRAQARGGTSTSLIGCGRGAGEVGDHPQFLHGADVVFLTVVHVASLGLIGGCDHNIHPALGAVVFESSWVGNDSAIARTAFQPN